MAGSDMDETHHPPENKAGEPVNRVVTVAFVEGEQGEQNVRRRKAQGCGGKDSVGKVFHYHLSTLLILVIIKQISRCLSYFLRIRRPVRSYFSGSLCFIISNFL